jgi:anthranilate synthase component 2
MILLIDNYDSFSYNLVQLVGTILMKHPKLKQSIKVIRNDDLNIDEIKDLQPSHIILSPGPGRPSEAGICEEVIKECKLGSKILGVCLGHQAICEVFGATITYAKELMHGKQSVVMVDTKSSLFQGLEETLSVARYHSLAADNQTMPDSLQVIGTADDGEVMAVKHREFNIYGVQFHPESVLTPNGEKMMENFLLES